MAKHFTKAEAEAKGGKKIRTTVAWAGVERGTTGRVVQADPMGDAKPAGSEAKHEVWDVVIEWDLPDRLFGTTRRPLHDWFRRDEYEEYFVEETE